MELQSAVRAFVESPTSPVTDADESSQPSSGDDVFDGRSEYEYCYLNLLSLLGDHQAPAEIRRLAEHNLLLRRNAQSEFVQHLQHLVGQFEAIDATTDTPWSTELDGWNVAELEAIRSQHGGLLLAVFHFGQHRHVILDLAKQAVPLVAPIAGRAYHDYYALRSQAPKAVADALLLTEVEESTIGRQLVVALKRGRIGIIYVDGNMGPDGHHAETGALEISFFGKSIRVKAGIARLALALGLPILPLFVRPASFDGERAHVVLGDLVQPSTDERQQESEACKTQWCSKTMAALYLQLQKHVKLAPEHWEYALCFHRWRTEPTACTAAAEVITGNIQTAVLNHSHVAVLHQDNALFLIDATEHRAVKIPPWAHAMVECLATTNALAYDSLHDLCPSAPTPLSVDTLLRQFEVRGLIRLQVS